MKKFRQLISSKIFLLFIITFLAHGIILLLDGMYHDDFLLVNHLLGNEFNEILAMFKEAGYMFGSYAYFYLFIKLIFGNNFILGSRILLFLAIFFNGLLVYKIARKVNFIDDRSSFLLAAISITYPALKSTFLIGELWYIFCLFIFLLASYLAFNQVSPDKNFISQNIYWRIISLILFFFSFSTNSLLVFYFGFLFLLFFLSKKKGNKISLLCLEIYNWEF